MATTKVTKSIIAKGLQEFVHPKSIVQLKKDIKTQMLEINGKLEFNKGNYHNLHYEKLMQQLLKSRKEYRESLVLEKRKKIAKEELTYWNAYIEKRNQERPDNFKINDKMIWQLKEIWSLVKDRKEEDLQISKVLEFHHEYAKKFNFDIPIEAKCLLQLVHPHFGYLLHFPGTHIKFEQLMKIYNNQLIASYERSLGQDLLATEISSLTFWNHFDQKQAGYMSPKEFSDFLKIFKFALKPTLSDIKKEFIFSANLHPGEFSRDINENEDIIRLDFYRYIFLERNL